MEHLVSIIIPVYQVEKYIRASLLSALNQTYGDIEYIVVDDCSRDGSMKIVGELVEQHSRGKEVVILRHPENAGLSAARNTGLQYAKGEFVFFMDSDDLLTKDCIELHVKAILKTNADFTVANAEVTGSRKILENAPFDILEKDRILEYLFQRKIFVSAWNKLVRRELIDKHSLRFVEGILHEDMLWAYDLAAKAQKVAGIREKTYQYIIRSNSITTSTSSRKKIESISDSLGVLSDSLCLTEKDNKKVLKAAGGYVVYVRFLAALSLLNCRESFEEKKNIYRTLNRSELKRFSKFGLYALFLSLPFSLFRFLLTPPYRLYKYYVRN